MAGFLPSLASSVQSRFVSYRPILPHSYGYSDGYKLMASLARYPARGCWRVRYRLSVGQRRLSRARYCKTKSAATALTTRLADLERATRDQIASNDQIKRWVSDGFITVDEAAAMFPGWGDTVGRDPELAETDYDILLRAYEEYALVHSKAHDPHRKAHKNSLSLATQVVDWLRSNHPDLRQLRAKDCDSYRAELQERYTPWSIHHYLTKLRILLDQAVDMGMIGTNPARTLKMGSPKTAKVRRILSIEEAHVLLEASTRYGRWINGGLATAVRLCLYAGLRPEEVCWAQWSWLNVPRRTLTVQEAHDDIGNLWTPKDYEARELDVKAELVDWLKAERHQGPFVLRGKEEGRPLHPSSLSHVFRKMSDSEAWDAAITLYSCRHTYATQLLRVGVDLRTVQARMGHESARTTEQYLHALDVEAKPTDLLPY